MGCIVEFTESMTRFQFHTKDQKQKIFIDALLKYSNMDIPHLACILDVPANKLHDVYRGWSFLVGKQAEELTRLFLVFFSD